LKGRVFFNEWGGEETALMLSHPGTDDRWLTIVVDGHDTSMPGQEIWFEIPERHFHLFDLASGETMLRTRADDALAATSRVGEPVVATAGETN
jgi:hypothetical protein